MISQTCFLFQGTPLNSTEATETFFAVTKLFQSKDVTLRRLVYLAIREMATIADDVIIVTSRCVCAYCDLLSVLPLTSLSFLVNVTPPSLPLLPPFPPSLSFLSSLPLFPPSLTKDMTGKEDQYRPSAIRALCAITDVSM